jgi:hypothetical protein
VELAILNSDYTRARTMGSSHELLSKLAKTIASSDEDCMLLAKSSLPIYAGKFAERLSDLYLGAPADSDIVSDFLAWCGKHGHIYGPITHAIRERDLLRKQRKDTHNRLVRELWLKPDGARRDTFLASLPHHSVRELPRGYPPRNYFACESPDIRRLWERYLKNRRLPDKRLKRRTLRMVDLGRLKYDVKPDESGIFYDGEGIAFFVLRNFCKDPEVLEWVDGVVKECVGVKRSVRVSIYICGSMCICNVYLSIAAGRSRKDLPCRLFCRSKERHKICLE